MSLKSTCLWYLTHPERHPNWRINRIVYVTMPLEKLLPWVNASILTSLPCWTSVTSSPRCCMIRSVGTLLMVFCMTCMHMIWTEELTPLLAICIDQAWLRRCQTLGDYKILPMCVGGKCWSQLAWHPYSVLVPHSQEYLLNNDIIRIFVWCGHMPDTQRHLSGDTCSSGSWLNYEISGFSS